MQQRHFENKMSNFRAKHTQSQGNVTTQCLGKLQTCLRITVGLLFCLFVCLFVCFFGLLLRYDNLVILGSGRSPVEGNGNPLQYSCLENPMDRGAWWDTVHGVAESDSNEQLNNFISSPGCPEANIKACYFLCLFFYVLFV